MVKRPCKFSQIVQTLQMLHLICLPQRHSYNLRTPDLQRAATAGRPARGMPRLQRLHRGHRQRVHGVDRLQALVAQQRQAGHAEEGVVHVRHILRAVRDAAGVLVLHARGWQLSQREKFYSHAGAEKLCVNKDPQVVDAQVAWSPALSVAHVLQCR